MKKIFAVLIAVLFLMVSAGCRKQVDEPIADTVGHLNGDVLYKGIEISQLFTEPFVRILGEPIDPPLEGASAGRVDFFFYESLEITSSWTYYGAEPCQRFAIRLEVRRPYFNLLELGGVSLDITRVEVLAAFGYPVEYRNSSLTYRISNPVADYMLIFNFFAWNDNTILTGIVMIRDYSYIFGVETLPIATESDIPVNIAGLLWRDFAYDKGLFGNIHRQAGIPGWRYVFDSGVLVGTTTSARIAEGVELTHIIILDFRRAGVARFHYNGLGSASTRADVEAAFASDDFVQWPWLREPDSPPSWWEVATGWTNQADSLIFVYGNPVDGGWSVRFIFDDNDVIIGIRHGRFAT